MRSIGDALTDLAGELVNRAFTLGEHIDDFGSSPARERLRDFGECVEQCVLGFSVAHRSTIVRHLSTDVKLSKDYLTLRRPALSIEALLTVTTSERGSDEGNQLR